MDRVITRIIEIENQCAREIRQAEEASSEKIESHRRDLEKKKMSEHARIIAAENARATEAIETLKNKTEAASLAAGKADESRFQDPILIDAIKEKIIAILLTE